MSFAHGSNDGQKGMGLIVLILVGIVPTAFALNMGTSAETLSKIRGSAAILEQRLPATDLPGLSAALFAADLFFVLRILGVH